MDLNEYQHLAGRTINHELDKHAMMNHGVFGLASEAGEVSGIMQKTYQGHYLHHDNMVKELGDCLWMIAEIATSMGVTLEQIAQANIDKLRKRYPEGFTAERSINREEYANERKADPSHAES